MDWWIGDGFVEWSRADIGLAMDWQIGYGLADWQWIGDGLADWRWISRWSWIDTTLVDK